MRARNGCASALAIRASEVSPAGRSPLVEEIVEVLGMVSAQTTGESSRTSGNPVKKRSSCRERHIGPDCVRADLQEFRVQQRGISARLGMHPRLTHPERGTYQTAR